VLLQVLEDGRLTTAQGRTVDFSHTVNRNDLNLGSAQIQELVVIAEAQAPGSDGCQLVSIFRPEFNQRGLMRL